jgi:ergothioneine biosynthesis protein EgtB
MSRDSATTSNNVDATLARYSAVRQFSQLLAEPLSAEDCVIQSMPDVSPTRWHLAHTTWFFETFVLLEQPEYRAFDPSYAYLFNSYYNTVGEQFPRPQRGLLSRPGLNDILSYRRYVDEHMLQFLQTEKGQHDQVCKTLEIGLNHEQQHQELILTDIKHVLSCNPLLPVYREGAFFTGDGSITPEWIPFDDGTYMVGHEGDGFAFDNESPRHRTLIEPFELNSQLVTCGQFIEFIEEGGYDRPELWLSLGWQHICDHACQAPLYWRKRDSRWMEFTLAGLREIDPAQPICHVSFFEADAYARWASARLPTEAEWEIASETVSIEGNFADRLRATGSAIHPSPKPAGTGVLQQMFGDVWEWTASPYGAYPGYQQPDGALGEYNGKFMCNQFVLRGGSCATSSDHVRRTYRNFFPPEARWQFSGFRLARDC